jgi:signal transduction histidine kinase
MKTSDQTTITILLIAECGDRAGLVRGQLAMLLPSAVVTMAESMVVAEGEIPAADAALIDGGSVPRTTADLIRGLRARHFEGSIVVITPVPDDTVLHAAMASLGAGYIERGLADHSTSDLGATLTATLAANAAVAAELRHARRVFAAGQTALALQHAINNPLAALMAEAQLLQMEELSADQRGSVDRMVELCRRIVPMVRRLDALSDG